jgi:molybdopterin molybdotransferase
MGADSGQDRGEDSSLSQVEVDTRLFQAGDNQRLRGEDLQAGGLALAQGTTLHAAAMGLLASLGLSHVRVWRALKVAIFSTGSEVLALGAPFKSGHVYDANRLSLTGLLQGLGLDIVDLGVVRDDPQAIKETFLKAQNLADVVITSGGVSMGEADHTKDTLKALGEVVFWHLAMRPGRPFALGQLGQCLLFALPGNPVAMIVTFLALVRPALVQLSGKTPEETAFLWAQSGEHLRKKPGRTEYQRGQTHVNETGELCVRLTGNQGSGILSSLVQGDCLIVLGHDQGDVEPGDRVKIWPLKGLI